jgi:chitinase
MRSSALTTLAFLLTTACAVPGCSGGEGSSAGGDAGAPGSGGNGAGLTPGWGANTSSGGAAQPGTGGSANLPGGGGSTTGSGGAPTGGVSGPTSHQVVGYFAQWGIYQRNYRIKDVDTSGSAERMTVMNYAFGNIVDGKCHMANQLGVGDAWADYQKGFQANESVDGVADVYDQKLKGNFNQIKKLKAKHPNLKVVISLGGWTWSKGFSDAALTAESRKTLVSSCIDMYIKGNLPLIGGEPAGGDGVAAGVFDGIDIDWEYPAMPANTGHVHRPEDTQNFTALLQEFRAQLDALDSKLLLTIAAPAGQDKIEKLEIPKIHPYLNFINLMTYDMHGGWDAQGPTNFHAPLYASPNDPSTGVSKSYSTDAAVKLYLDGGVPSNKLIIGVPFYGRGWTNVPNKNDGLYQSSPTMQPAPGTYEAGVEDYKVLKALGYPSHRDPVTQSYWIFNGTTFWSFDDPESLTNKMAYVKSKNLGGAMVWELDGDTADGELLRAVVDGLK